MKKTSLSFGTWISSCNVELGLRASDIRKAQLWSSCALRFIFIGKYSSNMNKISEIPKVFWKNRNDLQLLHATVCPSRRKLPPRLLFRITLIQLSSLYSIFTFFKTKNYLFLKNLERKLCFLPAGSHLPQDKTQDLLEIKNVHKSQTKSETKTRRSKTNKVLYKEQVEQSI